MLGDHEIENRFGFHKGTIEGPNATAPRHAELRRGFTSFAKMLNEKLPDGRAKSCAMTALQEASMWSHFGIAEGAPLIEETYFQVPPEPESTGGFTSPTKQDPPRWPGSDS